VRRLTEETSVMRITKNRCHLDLDSTAPARNTRRRRKDESTQMSMLEFEKVIPDDVASQCPTVTFTDDTHVSKTAQNMYNLFAQGLFCDVELVFSSIQSETSDRIETEDVVMEGCEDERADSNENVVENGESGDDMSSGSDGDDDCFWVTDPHGGRGRSLQIRNTLPCHKAILASFSEYFRNMFRSSMQDSDCVSIHLDEPVDRYPYVYLMVRFMYTGFVELEINIAIQLLSLCDKFGVPVLGEYCALYLSNEIKPDTCIYLSAFSDRYPQLTERYNLKTKACAYLESNFDAIPVESFAELSYETMKSLLEQDCLGCDHEGTVLDRLLAWLDKNHRNESPERIKDLWKLIRFDYMPNKWFRKLVHDTPYFDDWMKELALTQRIANPGIRPRECTLTTKPAVFEFTFQRDAPKDEKIFFPFFRRYKRRWKFFIHFNLEYSYCYELKFGLLCLDGETPIRMQCSVDIKNGLPMSKLHHFHSLNY
jgi:hypothetical protein